VKEGLVRGHDRAQVHLRALSELHSSRLETG